MDVLEKTGNPAADVRRGVPGGRPADHTGPYTWRARLGFVLLGLAGVAWPLAFWLVKGQLAYREWWSLAALWWLFVGIYGLAFSLTRICQRIRP